MYEIRLLPIISISTPYMLSFLFVFNDTATTEIYTLSLHDALPICERLMPWSFTRVASAISRGLAPGVTASRSRSEEHTSELQSHSDLVCRLLLEKKKKNKKICTNHSPLIP